MKALGIIFIIFGALWAIAGFASYASDIQLGIAVSGINMIGIGIIMAKGKQLSTGVMNMVDKVGAICLIIGQHSDKLSNHLLNKLGVLCVI